MLPSEHVFIQLYVFFHFPRHYVPEFVSRSNDTMVVLCDFFNCGGTTGTDEWFCYGIPGKEISLKDFKNYASLIEESCR